MKIKTYLQTSYPAGTYHHTLQKFLYKQRQKGLTTHTVSRLYYTLHPIGNKLNNPAIRQITRHQLKNHVAQCWLHYAPDTMRTIIGDMRHFFKWCKRKGHTPKNLAKKLKPIRRRPGRGQKRAAPEKNIHALMRNLANQLTPLIYRDLFRTLQPAPAGWDYYTRQTLRDLLILVFLYETGARVGELVTLGAKAINNATKTSRAAYQITVVGKTNDRNRYFTERTAELWRIWQQIRPAGEENYAITGWRNNQPPYPIKPSGISQMLIRRCQSAEITPFRANALRHAKVKRSRQKVGLDMASILIDHSDIATTWGYANIEDQEISAAILETGLKHDLW